EPLPLRLVMANLKPAVARLVVTRLDPLRSAHATSLRVVAVRHRPASVAVAAGRGRSSLVLATNSGASATARSAVVARLPRCPLQRSDAHWTALAGRGRPTLTDSRQMRPSSHRPVTESFPRSVTPGKGSKSPTGWWQGPTRRFR